MNIPDEIWARWTKEEYDQLRQAVLAFGGNIRKEAAINQFNEISLLYQEGETTNIMKGILYLTTKRVIFLPKNTIPHPQLIEAQYNNIRCLSGVRNDMSISISDSAGGTAIFQFPTTRTLYQCFNLLRRIAEATRLDEESFKTAIVEIIKSPKKDETPFAAIEFDLTECVATNEIEQSQSEIASPVQDDDDNDDPVMELLNPIKNAMEKVVKTHFDIHSKLRFLCMIAVAATSLQFIPFLPFASLCICIIILFNVWKSLKRQDNDEEDEEDKSVEQWRGHPIQGYVKTRQFIREYFQWYVPRKTMMLLEGSFAIFAGWLLLPAKYYYPLLILAFIYFGIRPLISRDVMGRLVRGFWLST